MDSLAGRMLLLDGKVHQPEFITYVGADIAVRN